jgi:hypothetical protein
MTSLARLGPDDLRAAAVAFRDALRAHKEPINRLNVYPVPDGDTGTNMSLTLDAVVAELETAGDDTASVCRAISHGSLMGARGNSGVIMSQVLRGVCDAFVADDGADGPGLAKALTAAAEAAYGAVMKPVEGTILTVARETAEAATATAAADGSLLDVLEAAIAGGRASLARTPDLLPVLKDAGVVDSGGTGFLLFIDALLHVVDGRPMPEAPDLDHAPSANLDRLAEHKDHEAHDVSDLRYEVMYLLEAPDDTIGPFKQVWSGIGDSIVVVGGDGMWNCHIHTDDIGASIEAALDCGRPSRIRVTDLLEEVEEERWVREGEPHVDDDIDREPVTTALVAIASGEGIRRIFRSLGVQAVVAGGQSMNPSTAQIREAAEAANADQIVVLPNNKNIIAVAEQVDGTTDKKVRVVPTRGIAEGFAALMAYDPQADADTNVAEMTEAAANVVAGEVTRAVRPSTCDVGPIAEGDYLGIAREGIWAVAPSLADAATGLLERLVGVEHEIITLIEGEGATAGDTRRITEWLAEHRPDVACEIHQGGQPLYPYYFGIE